MLCRLGLFLINVTDSSTSSDLPGCKDRGGASPSPRCRECVECDGSDALETTLGSYGLFAPSTICRLRGALVVNCLVEGL